MTRRSSLRLVVLVATLIGSASPLFPAEPEAGGEEGRTAVPVRSGYERSPSQLWPAEVSSANGVVVSGSEQASRAGAAVLAAGGNAVDAAVATAFALGVTEPMTSGLGAETFILIYRADGQTVAIDGSCYVPRLARATELQELRANADRGYLQDYKSAAVPGSLAALAYALQYYGTKPLADVVAPAIEIADFGYTLNPSSHGELESLGFLVRHQEYVADLLLKGFTDTWDVDHVYCASDLANTLRRIAASGAADFYHGAIADEIDADMQRNGGYIRKSDLE
ncbi:MAG TPA: gamma-glutamyltransferase, partial [Thermoanaerobaculaceae bacterium]|nr:gamma-glutamyltransferase [Thermoanaerobaculaceae bacterium]